MSSGVDGERMLMLEDNASFCNTSVFEKTEHHLEKSQSRRYCPTQGSSSITKYLANGKDSCNEC